MLALRNLPCVWHAPTTQAKDRKRMLRLLVKDITVEKPFHPKQLLDHIRWQGGAVESRGFWKKARWPVPTGALARVRGNAFQGIVRDRRCRTYELVYGSATPRTSMNFRDSMAARPTSFNLMGSVPEPGTEG